MHCVAAVVALLTVFLVLSYQRASLRVWTLSLGLLVVLDFWGVGSRMNASHSYGLLFLFFILFLLNFSWVRQKLFTRRLFKFYLQVMPTMSRTEREAITAGTVTWEGDLFRGNPNWQKLLDLPSARLSDEEKAFLEGPVETLCRMINDWDITHNRADLSPEIWKFLKDNGFFALIIPKRYGGKEFSAYAHSQILVKVSGRSIAVSTTIAVPNSLGPAELLLHYGTEQQKNYYLPRLATGEEMPCFALTSPEAGSDAGSMTDHGVVGWGEHDGKKVLGITLNFNKRYITLAPVATVIGLAFKLYDPDHLLGKRTDVGITCALIPRNTPGVTVGRRHFPLNSPFQNGPVSGKDVFIPLDWIIGGAEKAGKGWVMLMECLATGRAISLPATAMGGAKIMSYTTGAYSRIRRQFNMPIGKFEGVEEPLARIGAYTYIMDATRTLATSAIDAGEKPSVASAIVKYHVTELSRKVACDSMDIHGGKGICLGPKNYIGRGYEATPIAITVEGANILTRNMIIFGQGVIRCHPYVLPELEAARIQDPKAALAAFDKAVMKHIGFAFSNAIRTFLLGLTGSYIVKAPKGKMRRYFQQATRFCSALALLSDVCMLTFGGSLKRKESISARLGDILSYLYLLSAVLKQYYNQGEKVEDLPLVRYAALHCLFEIQERFDEIIKNFPNRFLAAMLKIIIFPLGERFSKPKDKINHKVAQLLMAPTEARSRLTAGAFLTAVPENSVADVEAALVKVIAAEGVEKTIKAALKEGTIEGYTLQAQAQSALDKKVITAAEFELFTQADTARRKVIAVDDFDNAELVRNIIKEFYKAV